MTDESRRPKGATAAAAVALAGSVGALLSGSLTMFGGVISSRDAAFVESLDASPMPVALNIVMGVALLALGAWGIASAIGLLRLRNWARLSFVVFAAMLMVLSSCAALALLVAIPALALAPSVNPGIQPGATIAIVLLILPVLAGLAIATWWLIYFTRARVRAQFAASLPGASPVA